MADEKAVYTIEIDIRDQKKLDAFAKKLIKAREEGKKSIKVFKLLSGAVGLAVGAFKKLVGAVWKQVTKFFKSIPKLLIAAGKQWAEYEQILTHAARTMNLSRREVRELGESLREMATDVMQGGIAASELGRIAGVLGQLGAQKEEVVALTQVIGTLGVAFGMSAEKAAEGMMIIKNVFNMTTEQVKEVGDAIAVLGDSTAATAGQIISMMQRMGGTAEVFGLTASQTAAIAATLRDVGVQIRVGATATSQILARIMQNYEQYAETLKLDSMSLKMALESNDPSQALYMVLDAINQLRTFEGKLGVMKALQELGLTGHRVQDAMLKLAGSTTELRKNMKAAKEATEGGDQAQEKYNATINTAQGRFKEMFAWLKEIWYIIGKPLAENFSLFISGYLTPIIEKFAKWLKTSKLVTYFLNNVFISMLTTVGEWLTVLSDKFLAWLEIVDKDPEAIFEALKQKVLTTFEVIKKAFGMTGKTTKAIIDDFNETKEAIEETGDAINETVRFMQDLWNTTNFFFQELTGHRESVTKFFETMLDWIYKTIDVFDNLGKKSVNIHEWMKKMGMDLGEIGQVIVELSQMANEFFKGFIDGMKSIAAEVINVAKVIIDKIGGALELVAKIGWKKSVFPEFVQWGQRTEDAMSRVGASVGTVAQSLQQIPQELNKSVQSVQQLGQQAEELQGFISSGFFAISADAAGLAATYERIQGLLRQQRNIQMQGGNVAALMNPQGAASFQPRQPAAQPIVQQQQQQQQQVRHEGVTMTINVTGEVLDETALDSFAVKIKKSLEQQSGRLLTAGAA